MSNPTKRMKYSEFMKLTPEERQQQSEFFRKKKQGMVPVLLFTKSSDLPELPNCKFLLAKDKQLFGELNQLRLYIQKNSHQKADSQTDSYFFSHNRKVLAGSLKVSEFINNSYKNQQKDGWVHIQYEKQMVFGAN